jgi:hypothetical protein
MKPLPRCPGCGSWKTNERHECGEPSEVHEYDMARGEYVDYTDYFCRNYIDCGSCFKSWDRDDQSLWPKSYRPS